MLKIYRMREGQQKEFSHMNFYDGSGLHIRQEDQIGKKYLHIRLYKTKITRLTLTVRSGATISKWDETPLYMP